MNIMGASTQNNRRIAKNTAVLYIRTLLIMAISLYTTREILHQLGVEDFGIYNVVGGVVTMLGFLNTSLSGASSRFITFAFGKGNMNEVKRIFGIVCSVHLLLALLIMVVGETVGLWFVYHKLVIPSERMTAALWVYQCSLLTTVTLIISVPYNALIIANERMDAFAYISIVEVVLKLLIVWILIYFETYDKLIIYAILLLSVQIVIRFIYNYYCKRHFPESRAPFLWDSKMIKDIASYAGWTINGNLAVVGYTQGINILLNLFFGPVVNTARGISVQVQSAAISFVQNFHTAIRPQLIKSYAASNLDYMHALIIASSKYGFFLMVLLCFPLLICAAPVLVLWLGAIPDHTLNFVRIMLFIALLQPYRNALIMGIHATGDIKKFQIYEGTFLLLVVPIAYVMLRFLHISPEFVMSVYLFVEMATQAIRIWIVLPKIEMSYKTYIMELLPSTLRLLPCIILPLVFITPIVEVSILRLLLDLVVSVAYIFCCIWIFGINKAERIKIRSIVKNKLGYGTNRS